jgi:Carboxypeptidase regulatory-like domain
MVIHLLMEIFAIPYVQDILRVVARAQQSVTGSISGVVIDPAGSAVSQALVTLTNVAQGTIRSFTTPSDGAFSFTTLEAAHYTLRVAGSSGFAGISNLSTSWLDRSCRFQSSSISLLARHKSK